MKYAYRTKKYGKKTRRSYKKTRTIRTTGEKWPGPIERPEKKWNFNPNADGSGKVMASYAYVKGSTLTKQQRLRHHDAPSLEYQYANSFSVTSGAGAGINPSIYTVKDIQAVFNASALTTQLVAGAFGSSTTQAALAPVASVNADVMVLIKNLEWTFEICNMAPSIAFGTLYIAKSRDDTGANSIVPSVAWETGVDDEAGVTATYGTAANVSSLWPFGTPKPTMAFRSQWTIVHHQEMDFDPGETKRHTVKIQINKERAYADLLQNANGYVKGITHYAFMVARGGPGDTSNTTAAGTIEFCPVKLIAVHGIKQRLSVAEKPSKVLNQYNGLPTSGTTNLYTMNDDTGANVNVNTVNYG